MARRTADYSRMLEEERLILAATELIYEAMTRSAVTKAELARRIGKTRGHVTQLLDGRKNMTLRTLADLAFALGTRVELGARKLSASSRASRAVGGKIE